MITVDLVLAQCEAEIKSMSELIHRLGSKAVESEWLYFQEYARRFPDNEPAKRYGILVMDQPPKEENMIYAPGPRELRKLHLELLSVLGTGSDGEKQRRFLDWLERAEGKR